MTRTPCIVTGMTSILTRIGDAIVGGAMFVIVLAAIVTQLHP